MRTLRSVMRSTVSVSYTHLNKGVTRCFKSAKSIRIFSDNFNAADAKPVNGGVMLFRGYELLRMTPDGFFRHGVFTSNDKRVPHPTEFQMDLPWLTWIRDSVNPFNRVVKQISDNGEQKPYILPRKPK